MSDELEATTIDAAARIAIDALRHHAAELRIAAGRWTPTPPPPSPRPAPARPREWKW